MTPQAYLKLICCIDYLSILDISVKNEVGKHGELKVKLLVEYEKSEHMPERIRGTHVNLYDDSDNLLFSGICVEAEVFELSEYRELNIVVMTHSIAADIDKEYNTYQSMSKTLLGLFQETYLEYGATIEIDKDVKIEFTLSQEQETDWKFLKRIAAQYGKEIFVNPRVDKMSIFVGEPNEVGRNVNYRLLGTHKDVNSMRTDKVSLGVSVSTVEYEIMDIETEVLSICPGDLINGYRVVENEILSNGGLLVNRLGLQRKGMVHANALESHNVELESQILTGIVEEVEGNFIQVSYPSDKGGGAKPWIPYESSISNSFYCMPDKGDEVYIYYDNTGQTVCLGSKRTDISHSDFNLPADKSMTFMGNVIKLASDKINLEKTGEKDGTQVSRITMSADTLDIYADTGININATGKIGILASNEETFSSMSAKRQMSQELHNAGKKIHDEHSGRNEWDKLGLELKSDWDKILEKNANSLKSLLFLDVLQKAKNGYGELVDHYTEEPEVVVVKDSETNIVIEAIQELVLQVSEENQILLNENINIISNRFEWVGTTKFTYQEQSVSDSNWMDSLLDSVQLGLDIVGLIPGIGAVPDLINAGISLLRGDFVNAAVNLISAIPLLGDAAQACKLIKKTANAIDTVKSFKVVKWATKLRNYAEQIFSIPQWVSQGQEIWTREGTPLWQDIWDTVNLAGNIGVDVYKKNKDKKKKSSEGDNPPEGSETRKTSGGSGSDDGGKGGTKLGSGADDGSGKKGTNPGSDAERTKDAVGDPVNVVTGSLTITHTDMKYNDILDVFRLVRTYESIYTNEGHMLGSRWIYNLESRMYIYSDKITIRMPDNHLEHFIPEGIHWCNKREGDTLYTLSEEKDGYTLYNKQERKAYFYNTEGLLETISDRNNNCTHFSYVGNQLSKVVLASGVHLCFAYEGNKLRSITDNINREISYEYEGEYLTKVYYPNGAVVKYEYDGSGNITGVWDENGQKFVTSKYDRKGRVLHQLMADGEEYIYFYDDANKVNTFLTVSTGNSVKYEYNRNNLVTAIVYPDQTREEKKYDAGDNLIHYRDRMGNVTTYTYDSSGNLLHRELPNGLTLTCIYDENNYLVKSVDNVGRESRFIYDANYNLISNLVKMEEGVFIETAYEYDDAGRVVAAIDGNGNKTEYLYDCSFASPTCVILADGTQKTYTYDAAGRMMSQDNGKAILKYAYNPFDCMTSIIDEDGNTTKFVYDLACKLIKIIRPKEYRESALQGAGIEYAYDALQRLVRTMNPCGDISAVQVNCAGATTKEIHPNAYASQGEQGSGIEKIYDMFGNMTHVKYPEGGIRRRIYNALGQCIKDIGPAEYKEEADEGSGYEYEYDAVGRMTQITDPYGTVIKKYIYNLMGSIEKEIDAKGMDTGTTDAERIGAVYEYNLCGWLTQKRQPVSYEDGKVGYFLTTYEYDRAGNLITEKRYLDEQTLSSQSGRVNIVHRKYDACGRLVCVSDNMGAEIIYKYDGNGNLTYESRKINEEHKQIRSWNYNKRGKVEQYLQTADFKSTRQKAARITFAYDENANLIKRTLPDGSEILYTYDAAGRVIEEQHKEKRGGISNTTYYEYDHAGNLTAVRDNKGITIRYEYDLLNRRVKEIGANGATTKYCYSVNGKLDRMIPPVDYAAGNTTGIRYIYDSCGRLTELVGRDNEVLFSQEFNAYGEIIRQQHAGLMPITYQYDFAGRRTGSISGEQRTEQVTYDALGNVKAVTDGNTNTTVYEYDTWGRITGIKHADGSGESYAYDYAGNIVESVDGNGNQVHYSYNEINKLSQITWQDATTEQFGYDISGNLSQHTLRDGRSIHYTYNMYQNLTSRRNGDGTVEESYVYDEDGRLKSAIASGMRYEYVYNPDGSLREKCASGKTLISYEYDLNGNINKQKDISGKIVSYTYDGYNRLNRVYDNDRLLAEYEYTAFGRKKSVRIPGITETGYEYDGDANLTLHSVKTAEGILAENRYAYDGNGNITAKSGLYGEYQYSYDELNRLTQERFTAAGKGSLAPDSYITRFTYDGAGNRITMEQGGISHLYTYDNCNRLIHEQAGDSSITYTYDVCGNLTTDGSNTYSYDELNRLSRITTEDGHVQRNRYDAEGLRAELEEDGRLVQFIYNHKGEVITEETGEEGLLRYIRGLGIVSSDSEQAKTYYHYVCDYAGSTSHVLNEQGEVENAYLYDAFGNITASSENVPNRFCYTGEQYDRIPNQYYLRARYYNPVIGRFTQQDTYLGAGLNLYAYCGGNPLSYVDPSGHEQQSAGDNAQDYTNLPSVQRMLEKQINAENKYYDNNLNAMAKVLDGKAPSQTNALMVVPQSGDLVPVVYQPFNYGIPASPGGDTNPSTALAPVAPFGSYEIVPFRNDAGTNPLDTAQRSAVSEAVSDAGGGHHEMYGEVTRDGEVVFSGNYISGGSEPGYRDALLHHTERLFLDDVRISIAFGDVLPGDDLRMQGELNPCRPGCQPAIRAFIQENGGTATYEASSTGQTFYWSTYSDPKLKGTVLQMVTDADGNVTKWRYWQNSKNRWKRAEIKE